MTPKAYLVATIACVLSAVSLLCLPFTTQVGGDITYYEPVTLLIVATTALVAIVAGVRSIQSASSHRLLVAVFILPLSFSLFLAAVSLVIFQHHRFL